jgi:hypothetical protein
MLERLCRWAPLAALLALAWSLRGAPLGTPVADDFEFMSRMVFHRPLDFFDSMGATYYWRPFSRQVWFSLVTPLLVAAPWAVAALHVALVVALAWVLGRVAGRLAPAPAAPLVTAAVLLSEPARALITWPSGVQHLLAALAFALTAHEALAGRRWTAALAAVLAALSHELGAAALVLFPLISHARGPRRRAWVDTALAAGLALAYAAGYRLALAHGVNLPPSGLARAVAGWSSTLLLGLTAATNVETLDEVWGPAALGASAILLLAALFLASRPPRRAALARIAPALAIAAAIWLAGLLPLGSLLPDWNAWRAFLPVVAFVFASTLLATSAGAALGLGLVTLRLVALLAAQAAGPVEGTPPPSVSDLSFARLARIQRTLLLSQQFVHAAHLPRGARIAYWGLPTMTTNGFRNDLGPQVWTADSSVRFIPFEGGGVIENPPELVLSYDVRPGRQLVLQVTREALRLCKLGMFAAERRDGIAACDYYRQALAVQTPESPSLTAQLLRNLALYAVSDGNLKRADSLNAVATRTRGVTPDGYAIDAYIALAAGDTERAGRYLQTCLKLDPKNTFGLAVLSDYQRVTGAKP